MNWFKRKMHEIELSIASRPAWMTCVPRYNGLYSRAEEPAMSDRIEGEVP